MANFEYTAKSSFKPFTFEEMLRPLAMYTDLYNAIEEGIAELGSKADLMRMYANELTDSKAAAMYNKYANDLDLLAESLAKQGLSPSSRQGLLDLKRRYSSEITPIELAVTRRRLLADEQRKAYLLNPSIMYERDFNTISDETSLDRFLENVNYDYGDVYSGALITSDVSKMASSISKELRGYGTGKNIDDYTKSFIKEYGLSSSDIRAFAENPNSPLANKVLSAIYNSALSRVPESIRNKYADKVQEAAVMGLWDAVGTDLVSTMEDYAARLNEKNRRLSTKNTKDSKIDLLTMALSFPKERQLIDDILGNDGRIKNNVLIFLDGKLRKPQGVLVLGGQGEGLYVKNPYEETYNRVVTLLLDRGFTLEQIDNMSQSDIEQSLRNIKEMNSNDVFVKNAILVHLNSDATKNIIETLRTKNIIPEEIEGFVLDKGAKDNLGKILEGKGLYKTKALESLEDLNYEDGWQAFQLYDKLNNLPILLLNGKYYKVPLSLYSNEVQRRLILYTSPQDESKQVAEGYLLDAVSNGKTWKELGFKDEKSFETAVNSAVYNIKERAKFWGDFQREPLRMAGTKNTTN